jgi:hypothetical protein
MGTGTGKGQKSLGATGMAYQSEERKYQRIVPLNNDRTLFHDTDDLPPGLETHEETTLF